MYISPVGTESLDEEMKSFDSSLVSMASPPAFRLRIDISSGTLLSFEQGGTSSETFRSGVIGQAVIESVIAEDGAGVEFLRYLLDMLLSGSQATFESVQTLPALLKLVAHDGATVKLEVQKVEFHADTHSLDLRGHVQPRSTKTEFTFDPLTELLTADYVQDYLERLAASNEMEGVCVLVLDVDRFGLVNDSLGRSAGDAVLALIANRLEGSLGSHSVVARLHGDEFVVVTRPVASAEEALRLARRAQAVLASPFVAPRGEEVVLTGCVGVTRLPATGLSGEEALARASKAKDQAKRLGVSRLELFDPSWVTEARQRLDDERLLRLAIDHEAIEIEYLPIFDASGMGLVGAEALMRWQHPQRGKLDAAAFNYIAEEAGLGLPLTQLVIKKAVDQVLSWKQRFGDRSFRLEINLSDTYMRDSALIDQLIEYFDSLGEIKAMLGLDISISALVGDANVFSQQLSRVADAGVALTLDHLGEFGAGLAVLSKVPFSQVKISRTIISQLMDSDRSHKVVAAMVGLAKDLEMSVCAMGVETSDQLELLRSLGVDSVAGFGIARPGPAAALELLASLSDGRNTK